MKIERPQFELTRVFSDGTREEPEIVPVTELPWDTKMSRRGALGFGLTAGALLLLLKGCDRESNLLKVREIEIEDAPGAHRKSPPTVLQAHKQTIAQLFFSADSALLTSSSFDYTVKQWSVPEGNLLGTVSEKSLRTSSLKVTPDGKTLISDLDKDIGLWRLPQGTLLKKIPLETSPAASVFALSADGKIFAITQGSAVKLYSVPEGELLATLAEDSQKNLQMLAFAPNGKMLVSGVADDDLKIWSVPDGNVLGKLAESRYPTNSSLPAAFNPSWMAFAPESDKLAMLSHGRIRLWSLPDCAKIETSYNHQPTDSLIVSPDGKTLITTGMYIPPPASPNSTPTPVAAPYMPPGSSSALPYPSAMPNPIAIRLQSFPELELLTVGKVKLLSYSGGYQPKLIVVPGGKMIAAIFSNSFDVWLLSLPDLLLEGTLKGTRTLQSFAVSPDGKYLATGDSFGTIMLWDLEKKEFLSYLFDKTANTKSVKGAAYNVKDKVTGRTITYTLPCGSPIPPGAVCTCNCVPGTYTPYVSPPRRPRVPRRSIGGSYCTCNKVCICIPVPSDRNAKESFETTDVMAILQRLTEIPIQKWNYKWDDASIRHIGPVAQDFAAAFGVGDSDKHIHPVDAQGVAFAAIQALYELLKEKEAETENLKIQLQRQMDENRAHHARLETLEKLVLNYMRKGEL